jgi:predicted  nucleic acid-binding Zn-ribbon protein
MPENNNINTSVINQILNSIKAADMANQREVRIDITTAKNLAYTLGMVMTRLAGNYEGLIKEVQKEDNSVITIEMDGGNWDEKK